MYSYAFDITHARFAIIIGLFMALLLYEKYKISPGGMVVPGYIALYINHPEEILYTFILAFVVYLFVARLLIPHMILFGRRRFTVTILTGAVFAMITESLIHAYLPFEPFAEFNYIGILVPGLIANEFVRENRPTGVLLAIGFVSTLTFSFVWLITQVQFVLSTQQPSITILLLLSIDLLLWVLGMIYFLFFYDHEIVKTSRLNPFKRTKRKPLKDKQIDKDGSRHAL
ncbi:MAG: poly-gamma-glutamate biosynthesis protein PgsC [Candidatus Thermoplasmatota archaeon]|nr:poly-gamma-glutamate biosynthesis protein PgsC [Candidatus Thermoplasmatota archaeon]